MDNHLLSIKPNYILRLNSYLFCLGLDVIQEDYASEQIDRF
jgi:hypothetical protein